MGGPSGSARDKRPSVTSRDVARAANVSQTLVSRAVTGNGRVSEATRAHILEVARQIGWQPDALARSMVTGDAPLVAVITTRLNFDWRAQVLSRLLQAIQDWQLKPLLFYADSDDEVDRLLGETLGWRTRGVIVTAGEMDRRRTEDILARGQFVVALNRSANHPDAFSVATDNERGGAIAAETLLTEGRERFLVLAGPERAWASRTRTEGFVKTLVKLGQKATVWHNEIMDIGAGKACAARYLDLPFSDRFDAVFSTNDAMALGFLDGVRESVCVPDNVSIIGYDDLPASSWTPYRLTTFEQPLNEMVARLIAHVDAHQGFETSARSATLPAPHRMGEDGTHFCAPQLILRATTRWTS